MLLNENQKEQKTDVDRKTDRQAHTVDVRNIRKWQS
jgi:hypothetical protein